jgi:hypothetical protein
MIGICCRLTRLHRNLKAAIVARSLILTALMARDCEMKNPEEELAEVLSEGLDLCVRARQMDAVDRRQATLSVSSDPEAWQADGTFDRHVARHNIEYPHAPLSTRSATLAVWVQDQYDRDLHAWEEKARATMMRLGYAR